MRIKSKQKKVRYKCKENDQRLTFYIEDCNIDEIHIGIKGDDCGQYVLGFADLITGIMKVYKKLDKDYNNEGNFKEVPFLSLTDFQEFTDWAYRNYVNRGEFWAVKPVEQQNFVHNKYSTSDIFYRFLKSGGNDI